MGKWAEVVRTGKPQRIDFETDRVAYCELMIDTGKGLLQSAACPASMIEAQGIILYY